MLIATSVLVMVIAGPLVFGLALGFALGRIGVSSLVEKIETLQKQVASVGRKVEEVKDIPVFPVCPRVPDQPAPRLGS